MVDTKKHLNELPVTLKKTSKQTTRKNKSIKRKSIKKGGYPYSQYYRQGHPKNSNNNITPLPIKYY